MLRNSRFAVAAIAILLLLLSAPMSSAQVSAEEVLSAQFHRFKAMHSFSGRSKKVLIYGTSVPTEDWDLSESQMDSYIGGKGYSFYQTTQFYLKGNKFLSSWESRRAGGDMRRRDTAYDGTAHQNFYRDARELVVEGKPMGTPRQPYYVPPAALDPYEFALYDIDMPRSFDVLNDEDTWAMLSDSAIVVGHEMVHGHSCIVIDIEIPGNEQGGLPIMSRVYFGEDLDFFPVQTEWFHVGTGYMYRRYRAWDIVRITNPEGDGIFVNRFGLSRNWKWSGGGEVSSGFLTETDLDTFEINPDLPDSMFTLPVYHALVYDNKLDPSLSFSMPTESNIVRDAFESLLDTPISVVPNSSIEPSAEAAAALFDDDEPLSGRGRKFGLLLMTLVGGAAIVLGVVRQLSSQKVK